MQLPIKSHYAVLAMLAMAQRHSSGEPASAKLISAEQEIPAQFLGQILQLLRSAGLVHSIRGANGGFVLARDAGQISVLDIVDAVCGSSGKSDFPSNSPQAQTLCELWTEVQDCQRTAMANVCLQELLERANYPASSMFYI